MLSAAALGTVVACGPSACRGSDAHDRVHGRLHPCRRWIASVLAFEAAARCAYAHVRTGTHTRPRTQNPNEFEVRFTPDATYSGYKLKMYDPNYFAFSGGFPVAGRYLTLTNSKHPESLTSAGLLSMHSSMRAACRSRATGELTFSQT